MEIPMSLGAFIASLQAMQEVSGDIIATRIAALEDRRRTIDNHRGDDIERIDAMTQQKIAALRSEINGKIQRMREDATGDKDLIQVRYDQDREAIEGEIAALQVLNADILQGGSAPAERAAPAVAAAPAKPDFAAALDDSLLGAGDTVDFGKLNLGVGTNGIDGAPFMPKAKGAPPIWRGKKPITEMTDAELDEATGLPIPEVPMVPRTVVDSGEPGPADLSQNEREHIADSQWPEVDENPRTGDMERVVPRFASPTPSKKSTRAERIYEGMAGEEG